VISAENREMNQRDRLSPRHSRLGTSAAVIAGTLATMCFGGCAHPPQAYVFTVPRPTNDALGVLAKQLEQEGHKIARIDHKAGEIASLWEDTHYKFRETADLEHGTNIFLRYHVFLEGLSGAGQTVRLTADVQRCAADSAYVSAAGVSGTCIPMKRMVPSHQKALNQLGERLSSQLAATAATSVRGG
jgi:hypothetical protein